jgi:hypothetical protein
MTQKTRARQAALRAIGWTFGSPLGEHLLEELLAEPDVFDERFILDLGAACRRQKARFHTHTKETAHDHESNDRAQAPLDRRQVR